VRSLADGSGLLTQGIERIDFLGGPRGLDSGLTAEGLSVRLPEARPSAHGASLRLYLEPKSHSRRLQDRTHERGPSYDS